jgi:hypothetical protein
LRACMMADAINARYSRMLAVSQKSHSNTKRFFRRAVQQISARIGSPQAGFSRGYKL